MRFLQPGSDGAAPVASHRQALAAWIHQASNPYADWYFGDAATAAEIIAEWAGRPSSELSLRRALIMLDGDRPCGCLIGLSGADLARARAADFAAFSADLGSGAEADEVIEQVVTASRELFPPVADDEYYISRVAVSPDRRGQGLGRLLVRQALEDARAAGFRRFRLDVSADNQGAIRAYQATGFSVAKTSASALAGLTYCAMTLAG